MDDALFVWEHHARVELTPADRDLLKDPLRDVFIAIMGGDEQKSAPE